MVRIHWGALKLSESRADDTQSQLDVSDDERGFEPHDAITGALERRVPARVTTAPLGVVHAIDSTTRRREGAKKSAMKRPSKGTWRRKTTPKRRPRRRCHKSCSLAVWEARITRARSARTAAR